MAKGDAERIRREAAIRRSEKQVQAAAQKALQALADLAGKQLRAGNFDPAVLSAAHPEWSDALETHVIPAVTDAYLAGLRQEAATGSFDATPYIARHIETVRNRLVGVADTTFDTIRGELQRGWAKGDDIPTLAKSVDALLGDTQRWKNRATTIARTEVIAANSAGARDAAGHIAGMLGHSPDQVAKTWLATLDSRVRPTHAEADGQTVMGLNTPFLVGGSELDQPGDPAGDPAEVVNCRCTATYDYPGDPGYPADMGNVGVEPEPPLSDPEALEAMYQGYFNSWGRPNLDASLRVAGRGRIRNYDASVMGDLAAGQAAWREYQLEAYRDVNTALRRSGAAARKHANFISALDKFIATEGLTADTDFVATRGINIEGGWDPAKVYKVGENVVDDAYLSTTTARAKAERFAGFKNGREAKGGWVVEVEVPKGTKFVTASDNERELLFARGTIQRVISVNEETRTIRVRLER